MALGMPRSSVRLPGNACNDKMHTLNATDKSVCQMHKYNDLPYTVESSPASIIPDGFPIKDWTLKGNLHLHCWLLTCQGFWKPVELGLFM